MQKVMLFSSLIMAPILIATAIWLVPAIVGAAQNAKYLAGFAKINEAQTPLTTAQVEATMGRPASIEESESADQTVTASVYHYPAHGKDFKVIFVHGVVFGTQFVPLAKS